MEAGFDNRVSYTGYAPVSDYVGDATLVVGLYSKSSGQRLPLAGEVFEPRAVKAGTFELRERSLPYKVVFREGWHAPEMPKGSGLEWRWSTKSGRLTFANPMKDAELMLELDQPNNVFSIPQHVEIRVSGAVVGQNTILNRAPRLCAGLH